MSAPGEVEILGITELFDDKHAAFISSYVYNGKEFRILATDDPPPGYDKEQAIEVGYVEHLEDLSFHDGTDNEKLDTQIEYKQQLGHEIKDIALPTFQKLAPTAPATLRPTAVTDLQTVQQRLYPDFIKLQLVTLNGYLQIIEGHATEFEDRNRPVTREELEGIGFDMDLFPAFPASQVSIGLPYQHGRSAYNAFIRGDECIAKIISRWYREAIITELRVFNKVKKANLGAEARIPTFKGLIAHEDGVVGFLMEKIPAKFASLDPILEGEAGKVSLSTRKEWAAQIEFTLRELHRHDIIWGDAKPANVMIDVDNNAWLIDFGGGFTPPWVDEPLVESREGDLHALKMIKEGLEQE